MSSRGGVFPEQWKGTVDGHSFYFWERDGDWDLEFDLHPSGRFANAATGVNHGQIETEVVEIRSS